MRYAPEREDLVPDVREYIAGWLNREAARLGANTLKGRLYSPLDVPFPE